MTLFLLYLDEYEGVGWERNSEGRLIPRGIDLGPMMDPLK
jgi:hypothetical protein